MADLTQSAVVDLLAHQEITHPGNVVGAWTSIESYLSGMIAIWLANIETTANATGVIVTVEGSNSADGSDPFILQRFAGSATAAETEVLTATEPIGETVMAVASTTNLTVGDVIYIKDDTSVATSEWHEIVAVATNTSITLKDGLAVEKVANDDVYNQASKFLFPFQNVGLKAIRVVIVHQAASGSDIRVKAEGVFETDIE
jgi:hypothetical protein